MNTAALKKAEDRIAYLRSEEYHQECLQGRVLYPEITILVALRSAARAAHEDFPQYCGYWDGPEWVLVRMSRRVKTKMGVAFEKGEVALARRSPKEPNSSSLSPAARAELNKPSWEAYSVRNRCNTIVAVKAAKEV